MGTDKQWSPSEALQVAFTALPDAEKDIVLLKALGIGQGVMNRIEDALYSSRTASSQADDDVLLALIEARSALNKVWVQGQPVAGKQAISKEMLDGMDTAIHLGLLNYVRDVAAQMPKANVGDLYESEPLYASALLHLIPNFEFPDWSWKSAGKLGQEVTALEAQKVLQERDSGTKAPLIASQIRVDDKVYFGRGALEFVGIVVSEGDGQVTVSGAELGCLSARRAMVTVQALENLRVMDDAEWAERILNEPAFAEFMTSDRYLALQAELEGLELAIAKGQETEATDFRIREVELMMENSPWTIDPDSPANPVLKADQQTAEQATAADRTSQCEVLLAAARNLGLARIDTGALLNLLDTGDGPKQGIFVGPIVGVDAEKGLVFQATGRGDGVVLPLSKLSRSVVVGEMATITFNAGRGTVGEREQSQSRGR